MPGILIVDDDDILERMAAVVAIARVGHDTYTGPEEPRRNAMQESCLSHERAAERMVREARRGIDMGAVT
ncbi:MAG: hypothetical protein JXA69_15170 [Phycisphaerae bacterium]|nr:hypothetical protein [Phycisphaerae bacterium]